jgi:hypothetical protein
MTAWKKSMYASRRKKTFEDNERSLHDVCQLRKGARCLIKLKEEKRENNHGHTDE